MPVIKKTEYATEAERIADFKKHVLEALDQCLAGPDPHAIFVCAENPHEPGDTAPKVLHLGCNGFMNSVGKDLQEFAGSAPQVTVIDLGALLKNRMGSREKKGPPMGKGGNA